MNEVVLNDQRKKLGINFFFNFVSQVLTLLIPLITAPYLARVLHESGNGQYSYSLSIITYFILFSNLGFDVYGQRQIAAHQNDKYECSKIFWEIFILKIIFTSIATILLYLIIFTVGFGYPYNKLILLLSFQVITVPFDIQYYFRGKENFAAIAIRTIIVKIAALILIFCFVKKEDDLWIYCLIMSLSIMGSNLIMWFSIPRKVNIINIHNFNLKQHLKPAILIFLPSLAITIYSVFDKTMIGILSSNPDYDNGCYEQAYKLNSVMLLLVTIISLVLVSRNANEYKKGGIDSIKPNLYFSANYVWLIGTPLIVGVNVLSKNLCTWFLGDGYFEVPLLLGIMSVRFISSGFAELFGNQFFIAIGKEKYYTIASVLAAIVNFTLNLILIPLYGAIGAAIATAACELVVTLVLGFFTYRMHILSFKRMFLISWKYLIASFIMFFPLFFLQKIMDYSISSFIILTVVGALTYFIMLLVLQDSFMKKYVKYFINIFLKRRKIYEK